jgi:hypothetical protein
MLLLVVVEQMKAVVLLVDLPLDLDQVVQMEAVQPLVLGQVVEMKVDQKLVLGQVVEMKVGHQIVLHHGLHSY